MNLGIAGRRALIGGSSRGLGRACAAALVSEGVDVVINGRDRDQLETTIRELRDLGGGTVEGVAADVTTPEGRATLLAACPDPDILITNCSGPTPGHFIDIEHDAWLAALEMTMLSPLALIRATVRGMQERRFGRIVNITSAMVSAPRSHQVLSTGARTGLTAVVKAMSTEVAPDNVTINNLLPERFDTGRLTFMAQRWVDQEGITMEQARLRIVDTIAAKRLGRPEEFGATCAFVCSDHAGYMSGMNIRLDGGSYPGLL
ncbi:MAG TPA: SDR family oxidoreductase [Baekduia sp.]|nr:SDR family oxidoreductase [Baekduia sp.]